jgi:hypothetical protein
MKKKQSLDRRLMISKNSILMLVVLVSVFLAIWAWFAASESADATGLHVATETPSTLDIAVVGADESYPESDDSYLSEIDFASYVFDTLSADVTGDGVHFIIPETIQSSSFRHVETSKASTLTWTKAVSSLDDALSPEYLSIPVVVRSQSQDVYISNNSVLNATLDTTTNTSDAGDFSRNGIAGAVRVSVVDVTKSIVSKDSFTATTDNLKFLWIPRPDIHLLTPDTGDWGLITTVTNNGATLSDGCSASDNFTHSYWKANDDSKINESSGTGIEQTQTPKNSGYFVAAKTLSKNQLVGNSSLYQDGDSYSNYVTFTDDDGNESNYYVYKFLVNIWIEGEDSEARRALNNGQFDLKLNFCNE